MADPTADPKGVDPDGAWRCRTCDFSLYMPVSAPALSTTRLGLYDDSRFPGRCLLAFTKHVEHMDQLPPSDLQNFWADAVLVGGALKAVVAADRINYAVLGNAEPHLHVHLIPRQGREEPLPSRPPWNDPRDIEELDPTILADIRSALSNALA